MKEPLVAGTSEPVDESAPHPVAVTIRAVIGGMLMGVANVLPGISGGTMLLAVGIYPRFVTAVADVTLLRWRPATLWFLGCVAVGAVFAIVGLAAVVMGLVAGHRWIMYSVFIGLTLGGLPLLWRMMQPINTAAVIGGAAGLAAMIALVALQSGDPAAADVGGRAYFGVFLAGLAAASAMVLPGLSGAYLLLILGQYETILAAVDDARTAVADRQWADLTELMHVFVPLGLGVAAGIVGVSNVMKLLLKYFEKATLGVLSGLLLGAVVGLWPFRRGVEPAVGDTVGGTMIESAEQLAELDPTDWPTELFNPTAGHILISIALILVGFAITWGISRLGQSETPASNGRRD